MLHSNMLWQLALSCQSVALASAKPQFLSMNDQKQIQHIHPRRPVVNPTSFPVVSLTTLLLFVLAGFIAGLSSGLTATTGVSVGHWLEMINPDTLRIILEYGTHRAVQALLFIIPFAIYARIVKDGGPQLSGVFVPLFNAAGNYAGGVMRGFAVVLGDSIEILAKPIAKAITDLTPAVSQLSLALRGKSENKTQNN